VESFTVLISCFAIAVEYINSISGFKITTSIKPRSKIVLISNFIIKSTFLIKSVALSRKKAFATTSIPFSCGLNTPNFKYNHIPKIAINNNQTLVCHFVPKSETGL
jgi:hypothetical protein